MRNVGVPVLLLGLAAGCGGVHSRSAQVAPACTTAERATLDGLQRAMRDSAPLADLERASADTATTAALARILADTASMADLRRLVADSTWGAQHQAQVDELLGELARFDRCSR